MWWGLYAENPLICMKNFRKCHDNSKCIEDSRFCDGLQDCRDGSDEINCNSPAFTAPSNIIIEGKENVFSKKQN